MRVVDAVERHAAACCDSTAVSCDGVCMSYGALVDRFHSLGQLMKQQGVGPGQFVGVMLPRNIDLVAILLATMKIGAIYIPLDPLYPPDRCSNMMRDAGATTLVTLTAMGAPLVQSLGDNGLCVIELDDPSLQDLATLIPLESAPYTDYDLAYCIFTSGSTGRPKGVPIYHQALMNLLESFCDQLSVTSEDTLLAITTICFDIAGLEMFLPLLCGATLHIATKEEATDPEELAALVSRCSPTLMQATPTTWKMLLRSGWAGEPGLTALCGGEVMPQELLDDLLPKVGRLINCYGPTETTIWSTSWIAQAGEKVQIGNAVNNTTLHILDDELNDVPEGTLGLLWIGGVGLSPGYLNREELNAAAFRVLEKTGERIYNTGDLVYTKDGQLFCCGRQDHQIKLRGYRIEADEIATVLKRHPLVGDCCVDLKSEVESEESKHLVAYVVMRRPDEIKRIYSTSDMSTTTEHRFSSVCRGSMARINSILDQSSTGAGGTTESLANDLEEVQAWGAIYDEAYSSQNAANIDPSLNFSGYDNSYTPRVPHQIPVVREWVETTCQRIAGLKPKCALEMGCGQGMIMLRCAKIATELYIACDLSQYSVNYCKDVLEKDHRFKLPHVVMDIAGAHEAEKYAHHQLDTVICNGVSMYFPSAEYLLQVIRSSIASVVPGGAYFLGDVRANTLFPHFHASTQLFQAQDSLPVEGLIQKITHSMSFEKEFLVDHEFFLALSEEIPDIADIRMDMKRGTHHSEFSMFRYDVSFWRTDPKHPRTPRSYELIAYDPKQHSLEQVQDVLGGKEAPELLALSAVPDARTVTDGQLMKLLRSTQSIPEVCGELRRVTAALAAALSPLEPEALYRLGNELGYHVEMMWSPQDECAMDVLFVKEAVKNEYETVAIASRRAACLYPPAGKKHWAQYTSKSVDVSSIFAMAMAHMQTAPSKMATSFAAPSLSESLCAISDPEAFPITMAEMREWKAMLRMSLPEYMVPSIFIALDVMPLTHNGKIDRNALPQPTASVVQMNHTRDSATFFTPVGSTQTQLAMVWGKLLHMTDTSANDDFFEAGGHSLLAMQLVRSIRESFGVHLPMAKIAHFSRLDRLAALINSMVTGDTETSNAVAAAGFLKDAHAVQQVLVQVIPQAQLPHSSLEEVRHTPVPMADGVALSARLWLPTGAPPGIAVVEVSPYRKADGTVEIDGLTFPYLAGHGFPCVRVDSRGAGDSGGDLDDEYSHQQIRDAADLVRWAAAQPWCDGRVVMLGVSWSSFIALQVAALPERCEPLVGVISVCATDSRYEDDMHYQGGALLCENLSWSSWLLHTLAMPPDPAAANSTWKEQWAARVRKLEPQAPAWMEHSMEDVYWASGSVKHAYSNIRVPLLLIGGTHGGSYHNSVMRMARACMNAPVKAVVGPWSHNMPHVSPLGPQTGFLQDCVTFIQDVAGDHVQSDVTLFSEAPSPSKPLCSAAVTLCGRWMQFPDVSTVDGIKTTVMSLMPGGTLGIDPGAPQVQTRSVKSIRSTLDSVLDGSTCVGLAGGRWFTFGANDEMPTDQAGDDALCAVWDGPPVETDMAVVGRPSVRLEMVDGATSSGVVVARLNAVAPNGISQRVTWGSLHVGKASVTDRKLEVTMNHTCFTVPKGYCLRLALSRDYFPVLWPELTPAALAPLPIRCVDSELHVQLAPCGRDIIATALQRGAASVRSDVHLPPGAHVTRSGNSPGWRIVSTGPQGVKVEMQDSQGDALLGGVCEGLMARSACAEVLQLIPTGEELTAVHRIERTARLRRQGAHSLDAECILAVCMQGVGNVVHLTHELRVTCDGEVLFTRAWEHDLQLTAFPLA